jgi:hypothetical protein
VSLDDIIKHPSYGRASPSCSRYDLPGCDFDWNFLTPTTPSRTAELDVFMRDPDTSYDEVYYHPYGIAKERDRTIGFMFNPDRDKERDRVSGGKVSYGEAKAHQQFARNRHNNRRPQRGNDGVNKDWIKKETGSYTNTHESGKTYVGKGPKQRSQDSGKRIGDRNKDPHTSTDHTPAENDREAFKQESIRLDAEGSPKSDSNYNRIAQPVKVSDNMIINIIFLGIITTNILD